MGILIKFINGGIDQSNGESPLGILSMGISIKIINGDIDENNGDIDKPDKKITRPPVAAVAPNINSMINNNDCR